MARFLIVNADDFGASPGVNRGIIRAHRHGVLTSTSLMVRGEKAADAVALSCECPKLALGLHVDLGEWFLRDGVWVPRYEVVPLQDRPRVHIEVGRQLAEFRRLVGREPTHLDSHQHVHLSEPVRSVVDEFAQILGVPLRRCRPEIRYCGDFYGQDDEGKSHPDRIDLNAFLRVLAALPQGVSELCCHPSDQDDLDTMYLAERRQELDVLCHPAVRETILSRGINLCSFHELRCDEGTFSPTNKLSEVTER